MGKKDRKQIRPEQRRQEKAIDRTVKMGMMIDIIRPPAPHILAVHQIENTKKQAGNGQHAEKEYLPPRIEKDRSKKDSRHGPGRADGNIIRIAALFGHIIKGSDNHPAEIEQQESPFAEPHISEKPLHISTERPESEHIHKKVGHIAMHESVAHEAIPFVIFHHAVRNEGEFHEKLAIVETQKRDDNGDAENNVSHHKALLFLKRCLIGHY